MDSVTAGAMVDVLERRQASLWHACQLTDFHSYLRIGGIPSRAELHANGMDFTELASDPVDRALGYWDQVFFNLDDAGTGFARGWTMHPNVFGPIVLQVRSASLRPARAFQFSLRSPANSGFDQESDTIEGPEELERCFVHPLSSPFPESTYVRFGPSLADAFDGGRPSARSVELSVTSRNPIALDHIVAIWVDPVTLGDVQLVDIVAALAEQADPSLRVRPRCGMDDEHRSIWSDLVHVLCDGEVPLRQVWQRADTSAAFRDWAGAIHARNMDWMFARFGRYLYRGTLAPLAAALGDSRAKGNERIPSRRPSGAPTLAVERTPIHPRPSATGVEVTAAPKRLVRACGHLVQSWDQGTCYVCVGRHRSKWRYDDTVDFELEAQMAEADEEFSREMTPTPMRGRPDDYWTPADDILNDPPDAWDS